MAEAIENECSIQRETVCSHSLNNFMRLTFRLPFVCRSFTFRYCREREKGSGAGVWMGESGRENGNPPPDWEWQRPKGH